MIPKVIHYCWFGNNPLPDLAKKCIESWKKYCPDYEIKEWNEGNIDIFSVDYMQEAYEEKAWGFVSDVARLQIIYYYGGIYLDTDVEIVKSFDSLLENKAFFGMEDSSRNTNYVNSGLGFGAEPKNDLIAALLQDYANRHFKMEDGTLNRTPTPVIQTSFLKKKGFTQKNEMQSVNEAIIYPMEYFCPLSTVTGKLSLTENTYSIHHYNGSWLTEEEKRLNERKYIIFKKCGFFAMPVWIFIWLLYKVKDIGFKNTIKLIKSKLKF